MRATDVPRCRHKNGELIEWMRASHVREVWDAKMDEEGYNEMENIAGYEFRCNDCGRCFKAGSAVDRHAPKWLKSLIGEL